MEETKFDSLRHTNSADSAKNVNEHTNEISSRQSSSISTHRLSSTAILSNYIKQLETNIPLESEDYEQPSSPISSVEGSQHFNTNAKQKPSPDPLQKKSSFHMLTSNFLNHHQHVQLAKIYPIHSSLHTESTELSINDPSYMSSVHAQNSNVAEITSMQNTPVYSENNRNSSAQILFPCVDNLVPTLQLVTSSSSSSSSSKLSSSSLLKTSTTNIGVDDDQPNNSNLWQASIHKLSHTKTSNTLVTSSTHAGSQGSLLDNPPTSRRSSMYDLVSARFRSSKSFGENTQKSSTDLENNSHATDHERKHIGQRISTHLFLKATMKSKSFINHLHGHIDDSKSEMEGEIDHFNNDEYELSTSYHENNNQYKSHHNLSQKNHENNNISKDLSTKDSDYTHKIRRHSITNPITQDWDNVPSPPSSLYSYTILFCLREGQYALIANSDMLDSILDQSYAFFVIIPQLLVVAFVQWVILTELWFSLPQLSGSTFCTDWRPKMYFAVVFAFVCSLMPSLNDLITDAKIAFRGKYLLVHNKEFKLEGAFSLWRRPLTSVLPVLVVCYEATIWTGVMAIGAYYIITSPQIGDIVQACVAIVFVNEIDNMAFWILDNNEDDSEDDKYGKVLIERVIAKDTQKVARTLFGIPLISGIVCIAIFSMHAYYC